MQCPHSPCVSRVFQGSLVPRAEADAEAESLQHALTNANVQGPEILWETWDIVIEDMRHTYETICHIYTYIHLRPVFIRLYETQMRHIFQTNLEDIFMKHINETLGFWVVGCWDPRSKGTFFVACEESLLFGFLSSKTMTKQSMWWKTRGFVDMNLTELVTGNGHIHFFQGSEA